MRNLRDLESDEFGAGVPPAGKAVEIARPHGAGVRLLGGRRRLLSRSRRHR
jgi:hypothetical protein